MKIGETEERILKMGTSLCITMKLQTPNVCESGVHLFGMEVMRIARKVQMTAAEVCYFLLDDYCEDAAENPQNLWNITFPPFPKPQIHSIPLAQENAPKLKVLHLSDTHYDPLYAEGSNANCKEPMCCRAQYDENPSSPITAAGKWGEFKCDVPKRTLVHLLDHIAEVHKVGNCYGFRFFFHLELFFNMKSLKI